MPLIVLGGSILLLLLLIARFKVNAFLALLIASFAVGLASGMSADAALRSILKGVGDTTASVALILVFGAILGKLIEESGASHTISYAFTRLFGMPRLWLSVLLTAFIVGLPMMYNAGFLVLIPLVYTLSATTGVPLLNLGIPMCAALAVTHGYLPPHPAPTSIALMYGANVNRTLLYGLVLTVPAMLLAGPCAAAVLPEPEEPAALRTLPRARIPDGSAARPGNQPVRHDAAGAADAGRRRGRAGGSAGERHPAGDALSERRQRGAVPGRPYRVLHAGLAHGARPCKR